MSTFLSRIRSPALSLCRLQGPLGVFVDFNIPFADALHNEDLI
jgi:hypothetical protein